ncbi:hypothetical protein IFO70_34435 [Phormidium tenue FACHB-886]|nr:hypothetical protein [Phormidium tenue FACHB-886]
MQWLITLKKEVSPNQLDSLLAQCGSERSGTPPIPLNDEQVIEVSGPQDLPQKLASDERVLKVSPNSSFTLY